MFSCCSRPKKNVSLNLERKQQKKVEELMKRHEEELEALKLEKNKELDELNKQKEEMKDESEKKFQEEISNLRGKCKDLDQELRKHELDHNTDEMRIKQLENELVNVKEHEKMTVNDWKNKLEEAKDHERTALEHERALSNAKLSTEIAKEKHLMEKIEELKKQHMKDEDEKKKRAEDLSSLQTELAGVQSKLKVKEEEYENRVGDLSQHERDALDKLRSEERARAANKERELNEKIEELRRIHESDESELENKKSSLEDLRSQLKKTQSTLALRAKEHEEFVKDAEKKQEESKRQRDELQKKMSVERSKLENQLEEERRKAKREIEAEREKEKDLELAKEKLETEIQNLRTSDEGERKGLEEKLKQAHEELEKAKVSTQGKEKDLNEKMNALKKKLELELEKEHKLESELKVSNERCARLGRAKQIFQKFLDVDDHGADILQSMEEFCESMVSSRGNLRGNEAKSCLTDILNKSDSKLRQSGMAMFASTKGSGNETLKTISRARFRTFLQVLFIRYPTLIGGQLLTKLKNLQELSDNDVEIDFWDSKYEVMMFNVPPNEDTMRGAITAIDKRMDKYYGDGSKTDGVGWEQFKEVIVDDMIGALHKHTREMGLKGLYMIDDYKEELAVRIKQTLREIQ